MKKEIISIKAAPQAIGPYSQGISLRDTCETVYFSGQIAIDPSLSKLIDGDEKAQTLQILKNIDCLLSSRGMTEANVVKTTLFLTDITKFSEINAIYGEYFVSKPARSCVEVSHLPLNAKVEIEIIAVK